MSEKIELVLNKWFENRRDADLLSEYSPISLLFADVPDNQLSPASVVLLEDLILQSNAGQMFKITFEKL